MEIGVCTVGSDENRHGKQVTADTSSTVAWVKGQRMALVIASVWEYRCRLSLETLVPGCRRMAQCFIHLVGAPACARKPASIGVVLLLLLSFWRHMFSDRVGSIEYQRVVIDLRCW